MPNAEVMNLADCAEFRQALQARPPRVVHGTALLLAVLLGAALAWSAVTGADVVVPTKGLVRPVSTPLEVKPGRGGQVVKVNFQQGEQVHRDAVLLELEADALQSEISQCEQTIRGAQRELAGLVGLGEALAQQFDAARAETASRVRQAQEKVLREKERQAADIRRIEANLQSAQDEAARLRKVGPAAAARQVVEAQAQVRALEGELAGRCVPVEEGAVETLRAELARLEKSYHKDREELRARQCAKRNEAEFASVRLQGLRKERERATLRAPIDGVVTSRDVRVGEFLRAEETAVVIAEKRGFHFEAVVPSEAIGHLRVGMPARIKLDAFDYQRYGTLEGTVHSISPDSQVQEQRGACYTVKIELTGDEVGRGDLRGQAVLGMAGRAEIVTGRESVLALLVKRVRRTISLG